MKTQWYCLRQPLSVEIWRFRGKPGHLPSDFPILKPPEAQAPLYGGVIFMLLFCVYIKFVKGNYTLCPKSLTLYSTFKEININN